MPNTFVILLAGGKSERFQKDKTLEVVRGKPVLCYSLELFERHPAVSHIVVVSSPAREDAILQLTRQYSKVRGVVLGGLTRQDSAAAGFSSVSRLSPERGDYILVHNAANPGIQEEDLEAVVKSLGEFPACGVGHPAPLFSMGLAELSQYGTLKYSRDGQFIDRTLSRDCLEGIPNDSAWLMQTPQGMHYWLAVIAFASAAREHAYGTDEMMLVEQLKIRPRLVPASPTNVKLTYPDDIPRCFGKECCE